MQILWREYFVCRYSFRWYSISAGGKILIYKNAQRVDIGTFVALGSGCICWDDITPSPGEMLHQNRGAIGMAVDG